MSDPRSPRVRSAEETILDLHAKIESDAEVIAALIERLRSFGPDWTKKITGSIAPYEVCANAADRIESDAKVIAALVAALAPFAASAYDRDGLPPDWEIGTPLRYLREARAAIAATSEQTVPGCEIEPHPYVPSATHMGDCMVCGHLQGAPHHSPFRRSPGKHK